MQNIINGLVVTLITEGAKRIQAVPLSASQTSKIRIVVAVLSVIGGLFDAYTHGALASSNLIPILGDSITNWIYATVIYHGALKPSTVTA